MTTRVYLSSVERHSTELNSIENNQIFPFLNLVFVSAECKNIRKREKNVKIPVHQQKRRDTHKNFTSLFMRKIFVHRKF